MYMPWSNGSAAIFGALLPDLSCLIFESFSGFFVRTGSLLQLSLSFRVAKSVDRVTIHSLRTLSTWLRFLSDSKIQQSCENEKKTGNYFRNFRVFRINIAKKLPSTLRTMRWYICYDRNNYDMQKSDLLRFWEVTAHHPEKLRTSLSSNRNCCETAICDLLKEMVAEYWEMGRVPALPRRQAWLVCFSSVQWLISKLQAVR